MRKIKIVVDDKEYILGKEWVTAARYATIKSIPIHILSKSIRSKTIESIYIQELDITLVKL